MIEQRNEEGLLTAGAIDRMSALCVEALEEAGVDRKDVIRIRLSLEEILELWLDKLGETLICGKSGKRNGRQFLEFTVEGAPLDPADHEEELMFNTRLQAMAGLALSYSYRKGKNVLTVNPPRKTRISSTGWFGIAIVCALVLGLGIRLLAPGAAPVVSSFTGPILDTMIGLIKGVSSPLIFFAICSGILNMGNINAAGKIAGHTLRLCLISLLLVGIATLMATSWLYPISLGEAEEAAGEFSTIYQMILAIVPRDIFSPFVEGNVLQVIFMAVFLGITLLVLGDSVQIVQEFVRRMDEVMSYIMGLVGKLLPLLIFSSILELLLFDSDVDLRKLIKVPLISFTGCLLLIVVYCGIISLVYKVGPLKLLKKTFSTFLIGLTTASSMAAMSDNMNVCENKLGISHRLINFALPLCQILLKSTSVIIYLTMSLCMAEIYRVRITPVWMAILFFSSILLSVATPPISGGTAAAYTAMFAQLSIPGEATALATTIDMIIDYGATATAIVVVQMSLVLLAGRLSALNVEMLRGE